MSTIEKEIEPITSTKKVEDKQCIETFIVDNNYKNPLNRIYLLKDNTKVDIYDLFKGLNEDQMLLEQQNKLWVGKRRIHNQKVFIEPNEISIKMIKPNTVFCGQINSDMVNKWFHEPELTKKQLKSQYREISSRYSIKNRVLYKIQHSISLGGDDQRRKNGFLIEFIGVDLFLSFYHCSTKRSIEHDANLLWKHIPIATTYKVQPVPAFIDLSVISSEMVQETQFITTQINNGPKDPRNLILLNNQDIYLLFTAITDPEAIEKINQQNDYWKICTFKNSEDRFAQNSIPINKRPLDDPSSSKSKKVKTKAPREADDINLELSWASDYKFVDQLEDTAQSVW